MNNVLKKLGNLDQLVKVDDIEYRAGKAKGTGAVIVDNGRLGFTVLKDKGMDILSLRYKNVNLSFLTKNGLVSDTLCHTDSFPFLKCFQGGFLYTCGLDNISAESGKVLHGTINSTPAEVVNINRGFVGDQYRVSLQGRLRQTALFGDNLSLERTITTAYDSNELTISDVVTNEGFMPTESIILYHMNFGYPFLDACTTVHLPVIKTEGVTPKAEANKADYATMQEPVDGFEEEVFYHFLSDGKAEIVNPKLKLKVQITFDHKVLPYLVQWKSMASGDYALGIEPSSSQFFDKKKRDILAVGEKKRYQITVKVMEIE